LMSASSGSLSKLCCFTGEHWATSLISDYEFSPSENGVSISHHFLGLVSRLDVTR
jgi:hypothetical protein